VVGKQAGYVDGQGYISVGYKGKILAAHRLAWILYYGEWPKFEIDHINRNRSDNRIENLRDVSHGKNMLNRVPGRGLRFTSVTPSGKWRGYAKKDGKLV
jgi:hypothetical protein